MKKMKNMVGYMLGNPSVEHHVGCEWCKSDCRVWICPMRGIAERKLAESQSNYLKPGGVWTTIYQVSAKDIACERDCDGLLYTNTPTKIVVDRVVFHKDTRQITDADLIVKARKQHGKFARLMLSLEQEREK